ncbi:hypothetical protein BCT76_17975 [Vibrio tasmaniensis]|uniref:4'-phosphopantetheinyl transferase family protein n=1 Tax=Vibrio tasmaniensis TaxID=212663 RepID=UPI000CA6DAF3|nr:4'-phosphopantetheinyl transferase superfamily protein [Vibrio tasmaniensis]PML45367.1 hypothetical protein BCT76_17975 [Vibrio tasmaniensis]
MDNVSNVLFTIYDHVFVVTVLPIGKIDNKVLEQTSIGVIDIPSVLADATPTRWNEFQCGRYAAALSGSYQGFSLPIIGIGSSGEPLWPSNVTGSISHGGGYAASCVHSLNLNQSFGVGVDVEQFILPDVEHSIRDAIVTDYEKAKILCLESTHKFLFTAIFSFKESFFKAIFNQVKRYVPFSDLLFEEIDVSINTILFSVARDLSPKIRKGHSVRGKYHIMDNQTILTIVVVEL